MVAEVIGKTLGVKVCVVEGGFRQGDSSPGFEQGTEQQGPKQQGQQSTACRMSSAAILLEWVG